jgi:hypothetical protein
MQTKIIKKAIGDRYLLVVKFDSLSDLYDYACYNPDGVEQVDRKGVRFSLNEKAYRASLNIKGDDWAGTKTFEECVELISNVPSDELAKIKSSVKINNINYDFKMSLEPNTSGTQVNVDSYIKGLPEDMYEFENVKNNKFINIILNLNLHCGYEGYKLEKIGTAVIKIIEKLEYQGYKTRVFYQKMVEANGFDGDGLVLLSVLAKDYKERLNLNNLYLLTFKFSAFYRRILFSVSERLESKELQDIGISSGRSGYGTPITKEKKEGLYKDMEKVFHKEVFKNKNEECITLSEVDIESFDFDYEKIYSNFIGKGKK